MEPEKEWKIKEICYDPYNATQFAADMEAEGYTMIEIRQGVRTLSEPTKNFREMVLEKKVLHDKNPVLEWSIGNAVTKMDAQENIMLDKSKSTDRIDPIASAINAHVRVMCRDPKADLNAHILSGNFSF
ncbi:terminase large subunit [Brevibacillus laterosporus GI-9]|nr:terminase large subunit [Brevibacillus laterosporus GI-9]